MAQQSTRSPSSPLRPHLLFAVLAVASIALFWRTLRELAALSLSADAYSYILLIPVISAFVLYLERQKVFSRSGTTRSPVVAALPAAGALAVFGLFRDAYRNSPASSVLSIEVLTIVLTWAAVFALCYGTPALQAARFPFLLLLLLVPMPPNWMERIVTALQWGAAESAYMLFRLAGVPIFRTGVSFELPGCRYRGRPGMQFHSFRLCAVYHWSPGGSSVHAVPVGEGLPELPDPSDRDVHERGSHCDALVSRHKGGHRVPLRQSAP